jgi:hypothetical protein
MQADIKPGRGAEPALANKTLLPGSRDEMSACGLDRGIWSENIAEEDCKLRMYGLAQKSARIVLVMGRIPVAMPAWARGP